MSMSRITTGAKNDADAGGKGINLHIGDEPVMLAFRRGGCDSGGTEAVGDYYFQRSGPGYPGKVSAITLRMDKGIEGRAVFAGPPLWKVSPPASSAGDDGATLLTWQVTPPNVTTASMATFKLTASPEGDTGGTELLFAFR